MKKLTIFVLVAVLAIAGASASGTPEGTEIAVGLGYGYDLFGPAATHGVGGINIIPRVAVGYRF